MSAHNASQRAGQRKLREQMRGLGMSRAEIAAEMARRYKLRPRAAWRIAWGWTLEEAAERYNALRAKGTSEAVTSLTGSRLSEWENWPFSTRKPPITGLCLLAEIYQCGVLDLIDVCDREKLPAPELLALGKTAPAPPAGQHSHHHDQPATQAPARSGGLTPPRSPFIATGITDPQPAAPDAADFAHQPAGPKDTGLGADGQAEYAALVGQSRPGAISRREVLADIGGLAGMAAVPMLFSMTPARAVASWASGICDAVVDPVRAARHAAASSWPEQHPESGPGLLSDLRRKSGIVTTASLMSDYGLPAEVLPGILGRAELAAMGAGDDERRAFFEPLLSDLYAVAGWMLIKADCPAIAWVAAKRAMHAASAAADCLRSAAATRCMAEVHMRAGDFQEAGRIAFLATAHLDAAPHADRRAALCLRGAAMLSAAAAAARRGDGYEARTALKAAAAYASELGEDLIVLGAMFGPANVVVHDVAVPVELGRPEEAVRNIPSGPIRLPPQFAERNARFLIDIARSHAHTGDDHAAEDALTQAETIAPDEVRHHRLTRQLIGDLLPRSPRSAKIRALAERCGVPALCGTKEMNRARSGCCTGTSMAGAMQQASPTPKRSSRSSRTLTRTRSAWSRSMSRGASHQLSARWRADAGTPGRSSRASNTAKMPGREDSGTRCWPGRRSPRCSSGGSSRPPAATTALSHPSPGRSSWRSCSRTAARSGWAAPTSPGTTRTRGNKPPAGSGSS